MSERSYPPGSLSCEQSQGQGWQNPPGERRFFVLDNPPRKQDAELMARLG